MTQEHADLSESAHIWHLKLRRDCRGQGDDVDRAVRSLRRNHLISHADLNLTTKGMDVACTLLQADGYFDFHRFHKLDETDYRGAHDLLLAALDAWLGDPQRVPGTPEHVLIWSMSESAKLLQGP